ncbi:2329_t:CDS:2, partial [Dentiscutata heterogama]
MFYSSTSTSTLQANEHSGTVTITPTITFQQPSKTPPVVTSQLNPMIFETNQFISTTNQLFGDPETLTQRLDLAYQYVLNVIKHNMTIYSRNLPLTTWNLIGQN